MDKSIYSGWKDFIGSRIHTFHTSKVCPCEPLEWTVHLPISHLLIEIRTRRRRKQKRKGDIMLLCHFHWEKSIRLGACQVSMESWLDLLKIQPHFTACIYSQILKPRSHVFRMKRRILVHTPNLCGIITDILTRQLFTRFRMIGQWITVHAIPA